MIVVTTPTGTIGSQVLKTLVAAQAPVRAVVRDPSRLSAAAHGHVEVVQGSHSDPEVIGRAFADATAVFWVVPLERTAADAQSAYLDFSRAACRALRSQSSPRVVAVSTVGRGWPRNAGLITAAERVADMVVDTGVACRFLSCASFMDNLLRQLTPIRVRGQFFGPTPGSLPCPTCDTRDIAAVAAWLLLDDTWQGVRHEPMLGPEDISCDDMAATIAETLGRAVRYQQVSIEEYRASLLAQGCSSSMADALVAMMIAKNEGIDRLPAAQSRSASPTTFRQWCQDVLRPRCNLSP